ncbi:hypothetical protein B0I37DRAFT_369600 [Chaetomium sp. MPI-CAGE-AT-0009]|nr:hypothetical protein B0I37DRAFT_369600 [Chaetomium sp. MPI-CAGE-AT-0009]
MALRANMKARGKEREPKLLGLVEAWMFMYGWHEQREMRAQSDALAAEVKGVRRWMHDRKVRKREERGERQDPDAGRSKHRGKLPAGTKFADGVPMPHFRLSSGGDREHHGSKHRGGQPAETKSVDGVPKLRVNLPNGGHQNHDVVYQAPGPVGGPGSTVNLEPPLNGAVRQAETWSSTVSSQAPSFTPSSSYSASSIYLTPSSPGPHPPSSSSKLYFTPTASNPYLTPSTSNPFFTPSSSDLSTFTPSPTSSCADAVGDYEPPRNNWYEGGGARTQGIPQGGSRPQRQGEDMTAGGSSNKSSCKKQPGSSGHSNPSTGTSWGDFYKG